MSEDDPPPTYTLHHEPPPLPPRAPSSTPLLRPPNDPRSASTVSLHPAPIGPTSNLRTLMLIYIHGFLGDETSFQSFPAHLHNLLTITLPQYSYQVHTKVYPKFKTRNALPVVTEEVSRWLKPIEKPDTDIVLIGHSMGGLLAAEVVLLQTPYRRPRHHIFGLIAFDVPFLGMHPGVISSGLSSLFKPAPPPPPPPDPSTLDELYAQTPSRNFSVRKPAPKGPWDGTLHFLAKHHGNLTQATGRYLTSHLEFGGALADFMGLKTRYDGVRAREDWVGEERTRFVNYYTASTGREKGKVVEGAPPAEEGVGVSRGGMSTFEGEEEVKNEKSEMKHLDAAPNGSDGESFHSTASNVEIPQTSIEIPRTSNVEIPQTAVELPTYPPHPSVSELSGEACQLPPLPPAPTEPTRVDTASIPDKTLRKAAEKEDSRIWKEFQRAKREYEKLCAKRQKALRKWEEAKAKEAQKGEKDRVKGADKSEKDSVKEAEKMEKKGAKEAEKIEKYRAKEAERMAEEVEKAEEAMMGEQERGEMKRLADEKERMRREDCRMRGVDPDAEMEKEKVAEKGKEAEKGKDTEKEKEKVKEKVKQKRKEKEQEHTFVPDSEAPPATPIDTDPLDRKLSTLKLPPSTTASAESSAYTASLRPSASPIPSRSSTPSHSRTTSSTSNPSSTSKPPKERKFCITPSGGDKTWIKVEMKGVDEVGAHCGLFFVGEVYERLVGDVAGRVEGWVGEERTRRALAGVDVDVD